MINFWDLISDYNCLVCTTNRVVKRDGRLVMGAGIAKQFSDKYEDLDLEFGKQTKEGKWLCVSERERKWIIGFPTKKHWKNPSDLDTIERSAKELVEFVNKKDIKNVLMTKPGCGLGGLTFNMVKPILDKYFDERFYVIN